MYGSAMRVSLVSRALLVVGLATAALGLAACGGGGSSAPAAPFDRAFIDGMVPHHRAALEMVEVAQKAGLSDPELRRIADAIVVSQQQEIDRMLGWREEWYGSNAVDPTGAEALGLSTSEMGMAHDAGDLASAADVDAAFASMMIDHHEGALAMAELADERAEHPELAQLAREIVEAQEREIAAMQPHAGGGHHG
jgi:uncharacterized protein (DUF305 family)